MKTWIGLALALIGLGLGLASTILTDLATSEPERASVFGFNVSSITSNSPSIVGFSLLILIVSFCLLFSSDRSRLRRK